MKNWYKKLFIPPEKKTTVVAYKSWVVRWNSKRGNGYEYHKECEAFISPEAANKFAEQIRAAFKLIRYSDINTYSHQDKLTEVTVEPNQ